MSGGLRSLNFSRMVEAFESSSFRRLWFSILFNSMGVWMVRLAVGWLVLDLTDSPFWVGAVASLEGAGQLAFGLFSGILVDRLDGRKMLINVRLATSAVILLISWLAFTGQVAVWHLALATFIQGALLSMDTTANNTVIYQLAGPLRLMNATALSVLCFNLARTVGSALAGGLLAALGVGQTYLIAGLFICSAALPLLTMRGSFMSAAPPAAIWHAARAGIASVWNNPSIRMLFLFSAAMETFAFGYKSMIPVIARDVLNAGPVGLGWLSAAGGIGAAAGTFLTMGLSHTRRKADWLLIGATAAGIALVLFGVSRSYALSVVLVAAVSLSLMVYHVLMNTLFQLLTSDEVRGRVMSIYTLTYGLNAVGGTLAGAIASLAGAPASLAVIGGVVLVYLLSTFRHLRQVRPLEQEALA